ncbi:restriction endonuclease subunit S [Tessaracoccus defluvii]|uniref:Restriction endonuclease subunit S n=1 Tax=Tessaracoccus defluvii TaxID=1285901 RepID=A0A7H0H6H7_9ACTN|nr:restriction endonuclease subunit S [Tessaracoccus defluvii]QNP56143.1 restriction endonuclease subunit S [Tessaracoccus defluvii]
MSISHASQPTHWRQTTFGRFARVMNGADYSAVEVETGGYPVFGSGGEFRRASDYLFDGESVLFGRKGTVDKPLYVNGRFWTVDTMFYSHINERALLPRFAFYWATTLPYGAWATDTALPSMTSAAIKAAPISLPPLPERRAIADFLDRETAQIDAFIAKNEELIALLTERRAATVSRSVTRGIDALAAMVEDQSLPVTIFPSHWSVDRFSRVARVTGGLLAPSDPRFNDLPLIAPNHVESDTGRLREIVAASEQSAISGKYPVRKGQVVYSKIRPALAKVIVAPENCLCSADMYAIEGISPKTLDNRFLKWQMLSKWFTEWAAERSMRVAIPKLNRDTLASAPILIPPLQEQRAIVDYIEQAAAKIDAAMAAARRATDLARERRAALISAAVTGKIDVGAHA